MKIFIATLNGGGTETLIRLANSLKKHIYESPYNKHEFYWHILIQGNKGCNLNLINNFVRFNDKIKIHYFSKNIGVVKGTNFLIDTFLKTNYDIFWIIDDDIELIDSDFYNLMIHELIFKQTYKTCCTKSVWFGNKDIFNTKDIFITIPDHGAGCTMFVRDIFYKVGHYDPKIIQYGSDTDFNNRIKYVYGENCLTVLNKDVTNHFNQTGTKNCYNAIEWNSIMRQDQLYLKNKRYTDKNIYL